MHVISSLYDWMYTKILIVISATLSKWFPKKLGELNSLDEENNLTSKKFIKTTYIPHFNNHFGDGCHLPVLNQFNMITYFLKMICKSQQCHSSIHETFYFSFIKSFILIMRFKRPFSYAYLELLSRESLAVAKNPSPPRLSQTPKNPQNIIQEKLYNIANDITFLG